MTSNELINIINKHVGYAEPQIYEALDKYLKFVITKTLETAAEKAKLGYNRMLVGDPKEGDDAYMEFQKVDKQSITDTFEETYRLFSVD